MRSVYHVYIISNYSNKVLYTGVTNNIYRRLSEHKSGQYLGFTQKYKIHKLLFLQSFETPLEAITAEKIIKGWSRNKKLNLIKTINPTFKDLNMTV